MGKTKETPLMKQYNSIKARYPDAMLLFRVGDFYETFGEDAVKASKILGIVLTKRANGQASHIELAGFPHHSIDVYLPKLVRSGLRVAICDQLEDPSMAKGIVKRGVTELVTPGVTFNDKVLEAKSNNFLLSVHQEKNLYGMALLDISTGEFLISEGDEHKLRHLIDNFKPTEIIHQRRHPLPFDHQAYSFQLEDWAFQYDYSYDKLTSHFKTNSLKGFGIESMKLAITAAGAVFAYLVEDTHHKLLDHITNIQRLSQDTFVWMDDFTIKNLELIHTTESQSVSLLKILDKTHTNMGGRMLRRWILTPLKEISVIQRRLEVVEFFLEFFEIAYEIRELLKGISDVERLLGKLAGERISPKELGYLKDSLINYLKIEKILKEKNHPTFTNFGEFKNLEEVVSLLQKQLNDELPVILSKGNVIKEGISEELDVLRNLKNHGKEYLDNLCIRESEKTGIPSLKIDFNNVFGYYLEVRNTHKDKVPTDWIRKQTLVNAERYITEELKEYESQILGAEEKIGILESELFKSLCLQIKNSLTDIQHNTSKIATIDTLLSFAETAQENSYIHPKLTDSKVIDIKDGRHPVIEKQLPLGESYVANSVYMDDEKQQILMITGPNMAGKSALLRQTALIVLMAQIGSYVPAKEATLGIVDKIFTRVGASDNLSKGESTFMVEMNETASILNNISDRSLILLDEIGRGTSTYDGVSIAWAIAEYLHEHPTHPKTLFATHYHELNEMTESFSRIKNFNVSIKEVNGMIVFLRKLIPGGSEHSFGIHVAKLAGMPEIVNQRAEQILKTLENNSSKKERKENAKTSTDENMQLSFFQLDDPILENIREEIVKTDINALTPLEALMKLNHIKKMIGG
ncbi:MULTISPECIES: DNA mismatch repair protein MutS [unclassified Apibacter]|uniref:DNA mismatch repair protein MutS n=1 Tax=unclassified Apibacter TaxID=2630820 RepID=UPI00132B6729|nr:MULTISPECIES: DNA mismatch repair protein MutS [unclassified Apibacter]MCX8677541.1 DNA mismatch repair protein MutS [Apibacter sp. B3919]MXO24255.1 DNA mismatch repair protein MutS [Apibacter sp. B3924]MXO27044.1 DNA mismatch repair protein MutS [Apibacter sp. B3813]MXO28829.1 DNA mismatch repair protein MutS [Apibacter sp. B3913]MXO30780.1 DNA mismatch repair protein MutS [Apibacter sp. B3912]